MSLYGVSSGALPSAQLMPASVKKVQPLRAFTCGRRPQTARRGWRRRYGCGGSVKAQDGGSSAGVPASGAPSSMPMTRNTPSSYSMSEWVKQLFGGPPWLKSVSTIALTCSACQSAPSFAIRHLTDFIFYRSDTGQFAFFGRERESELLREWLGKAPSTILVLAGPEVPAWMFINSYFLTDYCKGRLLQIGEEELRGLQKPPSAEGRLLYVCTKHARLTRPLRAALSCRI